MNTTLLSDIKSLARKLHLADQQQNMYILQCFVKSDGSTPQSEEDLKFNPNDEDIICTTGSKDGDEAAEKSGVLNKFDSNDQLTNAEYLAQNYGVELDDDLNGDGNMDNDYLNIGEMYSIEQGGNNNNKVRGNNKTPVSQPINVVDYSVVPDEIEWLTNINPEHNLDYIFMLAYSYVGDATGANVTAASPDQGRLSYNTSCTLIQDPYGTVFDSYTLEPLDSAAVTLSKKRSNGLYTPVEQTDAPAVVNNPIQTKQNGAYAFYVPDGTYKLDVSKSSYTYPNISKNLNPSYKKLYSDIYRGEDIIQHGELEHRDIPLDPVNKTASKQYAENNKVKLLSVMQSADRKKQEYVVQGRVTHPKAQINVYGRKLVKSSWIGIVASGRLAKSEADQDGRFEIRIPFSKLNKDEVVGQVEAVKKTIIPRTGGFMNIFSSNLQQAIREISSLTIGKVQADDNDVATKELDPILNTVQGYAKNDEGGIIPSAKVLVTSPFSAKPLYTTKANEKGYFEITTDNLPNFQYSLEYKDPNNKKAFQASTFKFMAQNKDHIHKENVNVYAYTQSNKNNNLAQANKDTAVLGVSDKSSSSNNIWIPVLGILGFLILSSATILGIYSYQHSKVNKE
jgi:hypothetical protein